MGATQETEEGSDHLFSPRLVELLRANPDASVEEVLEGLDAQYFQAPGAQDGQHTSVVQSEGDASEDGRKLAMLVANQHYRALEELPAVPRETGSVMGTLQARGFDAELQVDRTGSQLGPDFGSLVTSAREGDELVAYYAGHGANEGLCGVDDGVDGRSHLLENFKLQRLLSQASSRGANMRVILDCCHTGNLTNLVRNELANEQAESGGGNVELTTTAQAFREQILNTLDERTRVLDTFRTTLRGLPEDAPEPLRESLRQTAQLTIRHYEQVLDGLWAEARRAVRALLGSSAAAVGDPPAIRHYPTMGGPLQWLERAIDAGRGAQRAAS